MIESYVSMKSSPLLLKFGTLTVNNSAAVARTRQYILLLNYFKCIYILTQWCDKTSCSLLSNWHKSIATLAYNAEPTSTMTVRRHRPLMIPADARGCRFISVILGRKWKEFSQRGWVVSIYLWACENGNILCVTWKQGVLAGAGGRCRVCFPRMYLLMCDCVCGGGTIIRFWQLWREHVTYIIYL